MFKERILKEVEGFLEKGFTEIKINVTDNGFNILPSRTLKSSSGTKIIGVRAVGICSKCRKEGDHIIRDNKGKEIDDKDVACVNEAFGACKSQIKNNG